MKKGGRHTCKMGPPSRVQLSVISIKPSLSMEHSPASRVSHRASLPSLTPAIREGWDRWVHTWLYKVPPPPIIKGLSSCPKFRYFLVFQGPADHWVFTQHTPRMNVLN